MAFQEGVLTSGAALVVPIVRQTPPLTVSLVSAAGGRLVRLSADGGRNYFTPQYDTDATGAAVIVVTVSAPISHAEFMGAAGDTWMVRS